MLGFVQLHYMVAMAAIVHILMWKDIEQVLAKLLSSWRL